MLCLFTKWIEAISTTLKACLGVLPVFLILGLREYPQKYYTTFAGMLPEKWNSTSGSTPVLNIYIPVPLLPEHSHNSGIVLPEVLLNKLKLFTDLDMICDLDILPLPPIIHVMTLRSTPRNQK